MNKLTKREKEIWLMDIVSEQAKQYLELPEEDAQVFALTVLDKCKEKGVL